MIKNLKKIGVIYTHRPDCKKAHWIASPEEAFITFHDKTVSNWEKNSTNPPQLHPFLLEINNNSGDDIANKIGNIICQNQDTCDGFIVIKEKDDTFVYCDSLVYTANQLQFGLTNINKPIIFIPDLNINPIYSSEKYPDHTNDRVRIKCRAPWLQTQVGQASYFLTEIPKCPGVFFYSDTQLMLCGNAIRTPPDTNAYIKPRNGSPVARIAGYYNKNAEQLVSPDRRMTYTSVDPAPADVFTITPCFPQPDYFMELVEKYTEMSRGGIIVVQDGPNFLSQDHYKKALKLAKNSGIPIITVFSEIIRGDMQVNPTLHKLGVISGGRLLPSAALALVSREGNQENIRARILQEKSHLDDSCQMNHNL